MMKKHEKEKQERLKQWKNSLPRGKRLVGVGRIWTEFDQYGNRIRRYDFFEWVNER